MEVEAYLGPDDRAAHSFRGLTPRTSTRYGPPGHAYVYLVYGIWNCLNFVTRPAGEPHAILVRALEPGPGVGRCGGPGLVCRSLEIDRGTNGIPLAPPDLYLVDDGFRPAVINESPRIGVDYAGEWKDRPWRFSTDSAYVSKPVPAASRPQLGRQRGVQPSTDGTGGGPPSN